MTKSPSDYSSQLRNHFPKAITNPFIFRAGGEGAEEIPSCLRTLDAVQQALSLLDPCGAAHSVYNSSSQKTLHLWLP